VEQRKQPGAAVELRWPARASMSPAAGGGDMGGERGPKGAKIAREEMLHGNATHCDATSLSRVLESCHDC
jgi:hypothetical protein